MQLFYSGAAAPNVVQSNPELSLGKFASSSPIPNGSFNNIFPPISREHLERGLFDTRLIVLNNNSGSAKTNVRFWAVSGTYSSYKLGGVLPAITSKGPMFEAIVDGHSLPFQAVLVAAEGEANAINAGTIAAGDIIGIWIQREIKPSQFNQLDGNNQEALTDEQLIALLEAAPSSRIDEGSLVIAWD